MRVAREVRATCNAKWARKYARHKCAAERYMRTRHVCASVIKVMECIQMQDGSPSICDEVVHALCMHDDDYEKEACDLCVCMFVMR